MINQNVIKILLIVYLYTQSMPINMTKDMHFRCIQPISIICMCCGQAIKALCIHISIHDHVGDHVDSLPAAATFTFLSKQSLAAAGLRA